MSESESYEEVTVASDGITVIKTFEADAFPVPAIAFRIQSDRTEAVTVRLVDQVPENVAVEDLGFHPEYGSEFWTIEDDEITFEREIEAEEQYTTVYGIRATGTDNVEQFLTEPDITDVDPPLDDGDAVVGSSSDVVRDVISGDTDSVPGLDEEDDEDIGTLDLADPNEEGAETEPDDDQESAADDEDDSDAVEADDESEERAAEESPSEEPATADDGATDVESVASALAEEIRAGEVPDEDLELIRDELDLGPDGAVDARIEKLQTDVSDLEAYIDALEEFLEENGTGQDLIEDVQDKLDAVQSRMSDVQSDIDANNDQVGSLDDTIASVEDDLQSLKGDIKDLDDDMESVQNDLAGVEDELDGIEDMADRLESLDDQISDLKEWREQLSNVLGAADD